jgi:hypothetical protein
MGRREFWGILFMEAGVHVAIEPRHPVDARWTGVRVRAEKGLVKRPLVSASAVGPGTVRRRPFTQRREIRPAQPHAHADPDEQPDSGLDTPGGDLPWVGSQTDQHDRDRSACDPRINAGRTCDKRAGVRHPWGTRLCQPEATTKFRVQVDPFLPGGSMAERLMQQGWTIFAGGLTSGLARRLHAGVEPAASRTCDLAEPGRLEAIQNHRHPGRTLIDPERGRYGLLAPDTLLRRTGR